MSFFTTAVGTVGGFVSQDPFENPFSSIIGAGIGGFAGYNFVYQKNKKPLFSISDKINYNKQYISGEYNNLYFSRIAKQRVSTLQRMPISIERIRKKLASPNNLSQRQIDRLTSLLSAKESKYGSLMANMDILARARNIPSNIRDTKNLMEMIKAGDRQTISLINDTFRLGKQAFGTGVFANQAKSGITYTAQITSGMEKDIAIDVIKKHFLNIGNSEIDSARKAKNLQFALEGKSFSLSNTSLMVSENGKRYEIPITGGTSGNVKFTKIDDTFYVSKPFNPFMRMAMNGDSVSSDELKYLFGEVQETKDLLRMALDPEEMLALSKLSGKDALAETDKFVRESIEYLQSEAHLGVADIRDIKNMQSQDFTEYAQRVSSQSIGFMKSLAKGKDGSLSIRDIDTSGKVSGGIVSTSEYARSYSYLKSIFKYDPLYGQSVNTIGRYTSIGNIGMYGAEESLFPTAERGYGSQIVRSYIDSNNYNLRRLDIDSDIADWIAKNISGSYSIDDGSGLITNNGNKKLISSHYINFEIPRSANGSFLAHESIINALSSTNNKEGLLSQILVDRDMTLGFDRHGLPIKLSNVYSNAQIESADVVNDSIRLRLRASFDASSESWIKLFGTSSKAGYTKTSQHAQRMILAKVAEKQLSQNSELLDSISAEIGTDRANIIKTLQSMHSSVDSVDANVVNASDVIFKKLNLDNIDIITGRGEAGNKVISTIAMGTENEAAEAAASIIKQVSDANIRRGSENEIFKRHMATLADSNSSRLDLARSAMFMLAQTDAKGNADIVSTLRALGGNSQNLDQLVARGGKIFYDDIDKAYSLLDDAISSSVNKITDPNAINTNVSIDLGTGLHGIGNVGSMSWIEKTQLMANGLTQEMIDEISRVNSDALYELDLIKSSTIQGVSIDDETKVARGKDILSSFSLDPSNRRATLESIYGTFDDYVSHSLSIPDGYSGTIKSVPISTISTNRTNLYDVDVSEILSDLEKSRRSLIAIDLEYAAANAKQKALLSARYITALGDYEQKIISLSKGDGNIIKEAAKRSMDGSGIFRARSVGGRFAEYMSGTNQAGMLMSMDTILDLAKRSGVEVDFKKIDGENFHKVVLKGTGEDFVSLATREPAQGALSSIFANIYLGDDLGYYDVGIANTQKNIYKSGMFLDYDYDILKIASANFSGKDSKDKVRQIIARQEKYFAEFEGLISTLSRKGNKASPQMHASFGSYSEYLEHSMYSALKSKQRKILAPLATDIAMNMTDALQRHLSSLNLSEEDMMRKSILGRTFIHNMTEALIKSAHRSSKDLASTGAVSEIEMIKAAYDKVEKGDRSSFSLDFRNAAEKLFGVKDMDADTKKLYDEAIGDVTEATKSQAAMISAEGGRIQDFRSVRTMQDMMSELNSFQQRQNIPSSELHTDASRVGHGAKMLLENIKRNIYANKKPIGFGLAGLAATAMFIGEEKPEMTKEVLPYKTSDGILPVPQSQNAHVYKKKEYGQTTNIKARHHERGSSLSSLKRDTFGNHNQRTNITIRDKREDSY